MSILSIAITAGGAGIIIILGRLILRRYLARAIEKRIFDFQNETITRHCGEVENMYATMRGWRHDWHNHIQTLKAALSLGRYGDLASYLDGLDADLSRIDQVIKTGNTMLDAILNSKISLARSLGITVNAKAEAPPAMAVTDIDLCVVIGNLIDNAIEACRKTGAEGKKVIRVYVGLFKEQLYLSVSNTMAGNLSKPAKGGRGVYQSAKGENHGFGLVRVDAVAQKYGGYVNRRHEEGVFATEILLPLRPR